MEMAKEQLFQGTAPWVLLSGTLAFFGKQLQTSVMEINETQTNIQTNMYSEVTEEPSGEAVCITHHSSSCYLLYSDYVYV